MVAPVKISLEADQYEKLGVRPWFSYKVNMPIRPMPSASSRPHTMTKRLLIRPILPSDAEALHDLRRRPGTQNNSTQRGRPDRDLEETRLNVEYLQSPYDQHHWYFGAFLLSTGELIGEGGLPDCEDMPRSGWPEAEILIKPEYWRQGYGTELCTAVLDSWWDLPREKRRHQLLPFIAGDKEPGDEVIDGVGFVWEETNIAAKNFFAKFLGQSVVSATGTFVDWDRREGREGALVRWQGTLAANPRAK